ncbi:hypothetical protein [Pseudarthrobacter sp. GA104]|uniref:hypothetical protein n=1 Tax=Pseudarthrobacter sp. GA104 TaxID=2676311 RepID=UPI0012FA326F|nr:hypothetical protein [Pseudarthrobacter sp. GA104]MUU73419.1 hypothetical protein [Pseudarthrobacter sp. GA104]
MSIIAAPEQDILPLDFDLDLQFLAPVYDEQARLADRKLCLDYLKQWAGSFKREDATTEISKDDFVAAAERLATARSSQTWSTGR